MGAQSTKTLYGRLNEDKYKNAQRLLLIATSMLTHQNIIKHNENANKTSISCNNVVFFTKKILENVDTQTLEYLAQATTTQGDFKVETINRTETETFGYVNKNAISKLNEPGQYNKKQRVCTALANVMGIIYQMIYVAYATCRFVVFEKQGENVRGKSYKMNELASMGSLFKEFNFGDLEYKNFVKEMLNYVEIVDENNQKRIKKGEVCELRINGETKKITNFDAFKSLQYLYTHYDIKGDPKRSDDDKEKLKNDAQNMAKALYPDINSETLNNINSFDDIEFIILDKDTHKQYCESSESIFEKGVFKKSGINSSQFNELENAIQEVKNENAKYINKITTIITSLFVETKVNIGKKNKQNVVPMLRIRQFNGLEELYKIRDEFRTTVVDMTNNMAKKITKCFEAYKKIIGETRKINIEMSGAAEKTTKVEEPVKQVKQTSDEISDEISDDENPLQYAQPKPEEKPEEGTSVIKTVGDKATQFLSGIPFITADVSGQTEAPKTGPPKTEKTGILAKLSSLTEPQAAQPPEPQPEAQPEAQAAQPPEPQAAQPPEPQAAQPPKPQAAQPPKPQTAQPPKAHSSLLDTINSLKLQNKGTNGFIQT
jgi:hypothetical protein